MNRWNRDFGSYFLLAPLFPLLAVTFSSAAGDIPTTSPHRQTSGAPAVRSGSALSVGKPSQQRSISHFEALSNEDLIAVFVKLQTKDPNSSPDVQNDLQEAGKEIRKRGLEGKLREKKGGETYRIKP